MRKEIMMLGLAGLLGCEDNYDVSRVEQNIELTKPTGCETIKDIRLERGNSASYYQILCNDKEGNLTLYHRFSQDEAWQKINVR
mgnify:CR=1 FL=1